MGRVPRAQIECVLLGFTHLPTHAPLTLGMRLLAVPFDHQVRNLVLLRLICLSTSRPDFLPFDMTPLYSILLLRELLPDSFDYPVQDWIALSRA
jgi:hypothetical protein